MKRLLLILLTLTLAGCAGLPQRSYSLSYTDEKGRTLGGSVSLGSTQGLRK